MSLGIDALPESTNILQVNSMCTVFDHTAHFEG